MQRFTSCKHCQIAPSASLREASDKRSLAYDPRGLQEGWSCLKPVGGWVGGVGGRLCDELISVQYLAGMFPEVVLS